jgi:uncharacterized protein (DUF927 family)
MYQSYFNRHEMAPSTVQSVATPSVVPAESEPQRFAISYYNNEFDTNPKPSNLTWQEFCQRFGKHTHRHTKKGAPTWSVAKYPKGAIRRKEFVESISMAVLDVDDGTPVDQVVAKLNGYLYLIHSSYSHTVEHPKYRVIIPLVKPSEAEQWPIHWARINHWFGNINDPSTKDASRIYYIPCHPVGGEHFTQIGEGRCLNINELPELPVEFIRDIPKQLSKVSGKVKIEGIEDAPPDPLNPAIGLSRIVERCAFMQWASTPENQNTVSNPHWMAMTSNACRFEESDAWIHEASCHHDGYDEAKTDGLIARCRNFPAPITCKNIQENGFKGCPEGGCKKPSRDGITGAPAGLWMRGGDDVVNHAASPAVTVTDIFGEDTGAENGHLVGGYYVSQEGVFQVRHGKDGEQFRTRIASHIDIAAQTRDASGGNWGILVSVKDPDGKVHEWAMPKDMLPYPSTWKSELLKMGADIYQTGKQDHLYQYFLDAKPTARALCVMQPGWYGQVFVLPNRVIGDTTSERVVLQTNDLTGAEVFRPKGTVADWQKNVGEHCVGNSRLVLAVCAALAGPTLHLLGEENGGFHLVGGSSIGKTTAVEVAASVWGNRTKFVRNWRTTGNAIESVASRHNDTLLILDEISQVSAFEAGEIAYMLGNGRGKSRSTVTGSVRENSQWRLVFLSTGEQSLTEHMQTAGKRTMAGQEVRLVNLPADAGAGFGLFENIHASASAQQFATELKRTTAEFYGEVGPAFVAELADTERQGGLLDSIRKDIEAFTNSYVPVDSCGQVLRVGKRFALLAAVGELVTRLGILPWPDGEAISAAKICFHAWVDGRGGVGNQEASQAIACVRHFIELHGESRFRAWDDSSDNNADGRTINRAGFRRVNDENGTEYYVFPNVFRDDICRGLNPTEVAKALLEANLLITTSDGKATKSVRLPGMPKTNRVYHLSANILSEEG